MTPKFILIPLQALVVCYAFVQPVSVWQWASAQHDKLESADSLPSLTTPPLGHVRCSIKRQSSSYTLGEPIIATLTIANDSDAPSKVLLGFNQEGGIRFSIKRPTGVIFNAPQIRGRDGLSLLSTIVIKPNETYSKRLILNKWYEFAETGIHNITWSLAPPPPGSAASGFAQKVIWAPFGSGFAAPM